MIPHGGSTEEKEETEGLAAGQSAADVLRRGGGALRGDCDHLRAVPDSCPRAHGGAAARAHIHRGGEPHRQPGHAGY